MLDFLLPGDTQILSKSKLPRLANKGVGYCLRMNIQPKGIEKASIFRFAARFLTSTLVSIHYRDLVDVIFAQGIGFDPKVKQGKLSTMFVGYFQSHKWGNEPEVDFGIKLKISESSDLIEHFRNLAEEEQPLIVHIRLGDYLLEGGFGTPSTNYYASAIKEMMKEIKYKKIWLFSDEPEKALEMFPSEFREMIRIIPEIDECAAHTLEVMRYGKAYVIANSTFSWWGARLSYYAGAPVIYPTPWFKSIESPRELVPPSWVARPSR